MKIGMNMLLWTNHVTKQHYPIIDDLKKTGFDGIEIPIGEGNISHYTSLGNHLASMNMGVTAVTSLLENTNIASPNASIRQCGLDHLKWAIDMAHAAGVDVIGGPFHSAFAYFSRKPPTENEMKWSIENLQLAGEYAQQANIILKPEVLNRFECYLVNIMADMNVLLDRVGHPYVRAMYDTHHAHIEEKSQSEAILTIASKLKHVHVSENDRGTPGKGQVAWDEVFHTLKSINYNRWITIEAFSTAIPEFANSINVWRNFSPVKEIYTQGFEFVKKKWEEA